MRRRCVPRLPVPASALRLRGLTLSEHLVVSVLPSLAAYPHLVERRRPGPLLCVGDPDRMAHRRTPQEPPVPLRPLAGARLEARAVATLYGVTPLIGPDATEPAVRAALPQSRVVHLATHGLIDATSALASSVQLADGDELTAAEILALRIDADLVVLSACQTGTGTAPNGEEILGLGRALLAAGARGVVVTLWPVDDDLTTVLMSHFHDHRLNGMPTAAALTAAQRSLRESTSASLRLELAHLASTTSPVDPAQGQLATPRG